MGESDTILIITDRCVKAYENAQQTLDVLSNAVDESEGNALAKWTKAYQKVLDEYRAAPKKVKTLWGNLDTIQHAKINALEAAVVDIISEKPPMPRDLTELNKSLSQKTDGLSNIETTIAKLRRKLKVKEGVCQAKEKKTETSLKKMNHFKQVNVDLEEESKELKKAPKMNADLEAKDEALTQALDLSSAELEATKKALDTKQAELDVGRSVPRAALGLR